MTVRLMVTIYGGERRIEAHHSQESARQTGIRAGIQQALDGGVDLAVDRKENSYAPVRGHLPLLHSCPGGIG
ncbi:MAG: hypothetical protein L0K77_05355, partial [Bifidobacterium crudilactis]|uniref:hypothetical protein n=1 Tax=Bifidobacterium crudilactis TaxID=327277 RepID=UPI00264920E0